MKTTKLLLALLLFTTITFAQKSVKIRYQPKVGSELKNEMKALMDITIEMGDQNIVTEMDMGFDMIFKTISRKEEVNKIEMVFDRITMDMKNPMMNGSFDSSSEEELDPFGAKIAEGFKGVLNNPVPMSINTLGKLTEPLDVGKIFADIPLEKAKELQEQMSSQFVHFPENKVKVGDTWTMNATMNQVGKIEYTYTLKGIEKKTLLIAIQGKIIGSTSEAISIDEATISGDLVLDKKTGETLESNMVMDMNMGMTAQEQSMKMNMKAEITLVATQQ